MLIFLAPGLQPPKHAPPGSYFVRALDDLVEAAYSKLPEHRAARASVVALNRRSQEVAQRLGEALPEELQEFWEGYSGWFAMYSVGPLLANQAVAQQALQEHPEKAARLIENWRSAGWWSGRSLLAAAMLDDFRAAGVETLVQPGGLLQALRGPMAEAIASRKGRRLSAEAQQAAAIASPPSAIEATDVLWLSLGASSADVIAPVIETIRRQHGLTSQILDFDYLGSGQALKRRGLDYVDVASFMDVDALAAGEQTRRQLQSWWPQITGRAEQLPLRDEVPPRLWQALLDRLRLVLLRDAPLWAMRSQATHGALEAYRPKVVVGTHVYGPPMVPMIIAARRRGVPRVCLQHGVIGPRYLALPCLPYDEQLLFGSYPAEVLSETCPPGTRLTVTGHSAYDQTQTPPVPRPEVQRLREGARALVVLCTQFNEHMYYRREGWWLQGVADACRALDVRLVLKLHPSDSEHNLRLYQTLLKPGDDRVLLAPHGQWPLAELLVACDLMITRDSTVVFEANLLDRPVVTINLSDCDEELPYAATGGALGVYSYADIASAIERTLFDPATREHLARQRPDFLTAQTGPRDGHATDRIAAAIAAWTSPKST